MLEKGPERKKGSGQGVGQAVCGFLLKIGKVDRMSGPLDRGWTGHPVHFSTG